MQSQTGKIDVQKRKIKFQAVLVFYKQVTTGNFLRGVLTAKDFPELIHRRFPTPYAQTCRGELPKRNEPNMQK